MGNVLSLHAQDLLQSRTHRKKIDQHAFAWDLGKVVTAN